MNDFYTHVETKSEKIVTALYMVTNFFKDKEPMKWKLRDAGLGLLSSISSLKDKNSSGRSEVLAHAMFAIDDIVSLLDIARLADFISDMNYDMLRRELITLRDVISARNEIREAVGTFGFPANFFGPARLRRDAASTRRPADASAPPFGRDTQTAPIAAPSASAAPEIGEPVQKDTTTDMVRPIERAGTILPHVHNGRGSGVRASAEKAGRRESILTIVREKGEVAIKDIADRILGCSEKTIQRELVALVDEGVLKKRGERRWSRYSLA